MSAFEIWYMIIGFPTCIIIAILLARKGYGGF